MERVDTPKMDDRYNNIPKKETSLYFFGTDLTKIPCFKNSFMYGILSGIGGGLLVFMFTSRVPLATHSSIGVFGGTTITYFAYCRYQFAKEEFMASQMRGLMNETMRTDKEEKKEVAKEIIARVEKV